MAKIKIDVAREIGTVDNRIYGGFIEHLGRCIYGGIFEEGSSLSDERGYRRDVLAALKGLHMPVLRWPGGNFVSGYHWLDGVGEREQRPRRMELAWHAEESNRFGTHEFIEYCRMLDTEPYLCVNMGSGTMDEAQAWVEYCNGTGNTYWANLRRQHGQQEPYRVKYWGLGNEMYGSWQIGALPNPEDYAKKAREYAKVMKWTDPSIQLVSCGSFGLDEWDRIVLEQLAPYVDFHSIHIYTGSDDYYSHLLVPHHAERAIRNCQALIDNVRYRQRIKHPISVVYDEWNVWFRAMDNGLEERYTLADALVIATYLNVFVRQCRTVRMANLAQMVNVIAPIFTNKEGLFLQTIYHPLRLFAQYMHGVALDPLVECEEYTLTQEMERSRWKHRVADLSPFPLLDVSVTKSTDETMLTLAVVNRDKDSAQPVTIQLEDGVVCKSGVVSVVNADDILAVNSFEQPENVTVQERPLTVQGAAFEHTFPPHSFTMVRLQLA